MVEMTFSKDCYCICVDFIRLLSKIIETIIDKETNLDFDKYNFDNGKDTQLVINALSNKSVNIKIDVLNILKELKYDTLPPQNVYKFYEYIKSRKNKKYKALKRKQIYFSSYLELNDPIDGKIGRIFNKIKKTDYRVFCTSMSQNSNQLWTYYSSGYMGVRATYCPDDIIGALEKNDHYKILYGRIEYLSYEQMKNINLIMKMISKKDDFLWKLRILFVKDECWKKEKEYRFICSFDYNVFLVPISKRKIKCGKYVPEKHFLRGLR